LPSWHGDPPRLASRSVLDPVRVRCQVRLDRLDADNMRVRADIEDLRGERMRGGNEYDLRLLTQIEPQPQGAMHREVTDKTIRQRAVLIFLVGGALTFPVFVLRRLAVSTLGITGH
jgi:hypothetical protein